MAARTLDVYISPPLRAGAAPALHEGLTELIEWAIRPSSTGDRQIRVQAPLLRSRLLVAPARGWETPSGLLKSDRLSWSAFPDGEARWRVLQSSMVQVERLIAHAERFVAVAQKLRTGGGPVSLDVCVRIPRVLAENEAGAAVLDAIRGFAQRICTTPRGGGDSRFGVTLNASCDTYDATQQEPYPPAFDALLEGTRADRRGLGRVRGLLLEGNLEWAVALLLEIEQESRSGNRHLAGDATPTDISLMAGELSAALLGGPLQTSLKSDTNSTEFATVRALLARQVDGNEIRVHQDLPSRTALGYTVPERELYTTMASGPRLAWPDLQSWFATLTKATEDPWARIPLHLTAPPVTRAGAALLFHCATIALCQPVVEAEREWYLRTLERALRHAHLGFIHLGEQEGIIRSGLWLAAARGLLWLAGVEVSDKLSKKQNWLQLGEDRILTSQELLLRTGLEDKAIAVGEAWDAFTTLQGLQRGATVERQAREALWRVAHAGPTPAAREGVFTDCPQTTCLRTRALLLAGATEPAGGAPPAVEEDWTVPRAHFVVIGPNAVSETEALAWFVHGEVPCTGDKSQLFGVLRPDIWPVGVAVPALANRESSVFVNVPADLPYAPYYEHLERVSEEHGVQLRSDRKPDISDRLKHIQEELSACPVSIHDLSRHHGVGAANTARMNMPLELGLALATKPRKTILVLVDATDPVEAYVSDLRASPGFLLRAYRGRTQFEKAISDAFLLWGFQRRTR